jgi:hypothetical protein
MTMNQMSVESRTASIFTLFSLLLCLIAGELAAQDASFVRPETPANVLTPDEWRRTDAAIDRALRWLASQQNADGSFPTMDNGQPGVTSLCLMAFLSHGHVPGDGRYSKPLEQAADYIVSCRA